MTESKRGRPAQVPDLDRVIKLINDGKYDERILEIHDALQNRREVLKAQVLEKVRAIFGPDADVVVEPKAAKANPFIQKANSQSSSQPDNDVLPGPYKTNPDDTNAYRLDKDFENGMIQITDPMGGHVHQIPRAEWDSWEEPQGDSGNGQFDSAPDLPIDSGDVSFERRGPTIGGLSAADMVGTAGKG